MSDSQNSIGGRPRFDSARSRQVMAVSLHPDEIEFLNKVAEARNKSRSSIVSDIVRRVMRSS